MKMYLDRILNNTRALKGLAVGLVLIVAAGALIMNQRTVETGPGDTADQEIATYRNEGRGFSFDYPKRGEIFSDVQLPQLVSLVLPEAYLDADGNPGNYAIEIASGTVQGYRPYSKEIPTSKGLITLNLIGPSSQEPPENVKKALKIVRDSFRMGQ